MRQIGIVKTALPLGDEQKLSFKLTSGAEILGIVTNPNDGHSYLHTMYDVDDKTKTGQERHFKVFRTNSPKIPDMFDENLEYIGSYWPLRCSNALHLFEVK